MCKKGTLRTSPLGLIYDVNSVGDCSRHRRVYLSERTACRRRNASGEEGRLMFICRMKVIPSVPEENADCVQALLLAERAEPPAQRGS